MFDADCTQISDWIGLTQRDSDFDAIFGFLKDCRTMLVREGKEETHISICRSPQCIGYLPVTDVYYYLLERKH